ncbi:MAG: Hsp20/alpha crystallin family protein [Myxococcota bacterium]
MLVPWVDIDRAFNQAEALHRQVNALLGMESALRATPLTSTPRWSENDEGYTLSVDLPGLVQEDVELAVHHRHLSLKAKRSLSWPDGTQVRHRERRAFQLDRTWTLPQTADVEQTEAALTDGVLTIRIPKTPKATPRRIEVQHG